MPGKRKGRDPRIIRTHNSLMQALQTLLESRSFKGIMVNDLCEEAHVSRAAFYAHFKDKYDLLRCYLMGLRAKIAPEGISRDAMEDAINQFIWGNERLISNLLEDADDELVGLLLEFLATLIGMDASMLILRKTNPGQALLANFVVGGLFNLLLWQKKNKFPRELPMFNSYLLGILHALRQWQARQDFSD